MPLPSAHAYGRLTLRLLYELALTPSPTGREEEAARLFSRLAEELGLRTWRDEAGNAYAAPPEASEVRVLLAGHIDTVEPYYPPRLDGDAITGRGVVDAKGPLASMLAALASLGEENPSTPAAVAALVGEEGDSRGARWLVGRRAITPEHVIIGEPTNTDGVAVAYRGSARFRVECRGSGGHTSSPETLDSALSKLLRALEKIETTVPQGYTLVPIELCAPNPGGSVAPVEAWARLDARIPVGGSHINLLNTLRIMVDDGCTVGLEGEPTPPVRVPVTVPAVRALVKALRSEGVKPRIVFKRGTSDMNLLVSLTRSIAAYGPGDPRLAHTMEERVTAEELGLAVKVYRRAVMFLAGRKGL